MAAEYQLASKGSPRKSMGFFRQLSRPMVSLGPFGLCPDVRLRIRVDKVRRKYTVNETELATNLNQHKIRPEGNLSEFHNITLSDVERRNKHIPLFATEYAFMYPLSDLSSATDEQLESCFGAMKGSSWMPSAAALCFGAFIYMDKGSQVSRINALVEDDGMSQSFFLFNGPFDLLPELTARLVEQNMLQPLTFRTLRASSAVKFSWITSQQFPELDIPHGAFAYKFENPINDRYFALVDFPVLCSPMHNRPAESQNRGPGKLPQELETILNQTAGFALGYPATSKSGASYSLQNQVPFQLRMTTAFLVALGRNPNDKFMVVKSGEGHYEFKPDEPEPQGLRWVSLKKPLKSLKQPIRWSSKHAEAWLREWYTSPVITECLNSLQVESLEDIFGAGEYDINPSKLVEFEQSTRIAVGKHLPPFFYRALLTLTGDVRYIQYFWQTKSFALNSFLDLELLQDAILSSNTFARDLMTDLLQRVVDCPPDFGFRDAAHVGGTLERSLTELSTGVVISQEGCFLLGNYNQIVEPGPRAVPILFLAAGSLSQSIATAHFHTIHFLVNITPHIHFFSIF
eukprot:EG_transcript_6292